MLGNDVRAATSTGAWLSASSSASLAYVLMDHTTFGFAARMAGGNVRAAQACRACRSAG